MLYKNFFKRFLDFWISLVALICISPLLIIVTIWLHFANKGAGAFLLQEVTIGKGYGFRLYRGDDTGLVRFDGLRDIGYVARDLLATLVTVCGIGGFKKKMGDITKAEDFYEWTFYLIFSMLNVYVRTQVKTINGRADIVIRMPDAIYVLELKICSAQSDASHLKNGTAKEALQQINSYGYAIPYQTDGRRVVKVGIRFSTETLAIEDWEIEG